MASFRGRPIVACVISFTGSVLTLLNVTLIVTSGDVLLYQSGSTRFVFGFQQALDWMPLLLVPSVLGVASAVLIGWLPRYHVVLGMAVVILALLGLPAGGGFLVGLLLTIIGGVWAIVWRRPA